MKRILLSEIKKSIPCFYTACKFHVQSQTLTKDIDEEYEFDFSDDRDIQEYTFDMEDYDFNAPIEFEDFVVLLEGSPIFNIVQNNKIRYRCMNKDYSIITCGEYVKNDFFVICSQKLIQIWSIDTCNSVLSVCATSEKNPIQHVWFFSQSNSSYIFDNPENDLNFKRLIKSKLRKINKFDKESKIMSKIEKDWFWT